jgi:hypothetical protein
MKENEMGKACMGEKWINILVGKPEGERPLGKPKRRWEEIM